MITKKFAIGIVSLITVITLAACASGDKETTPKKETNQTENTESNQGGMDHSNMDHSSSGEVPEDLKEAEDPKFEVGSKAVIKDAHMEGMKGAEATIVGAYDTTAYTVSYTPTTGGERVENHKWVIHEELKDVGDEPLEPGTEVVINASHMEGMDGATAEIDSAEQTTVYMIDFTTTTGGEKVTNHKWVTEDELEAE